MSFSCKVYYFLFMIMRCQLWYLLNDYERVVQVYCLLIEFGRYTNLRLQIKSYKALTWFGGKEGCVFAFVFILDFYLGSTPKRRGVFLFILHQLLTSSASY